MGHYAMIDSLSSINLRTCKAAWRKFPWLDTCYDLLWCYLYSRSCSTEEEALKLDPCYDLFIVLFEGRTWQSPTFYQQAWFRVIHQENVTKNILWLATRGLFCVAGHNARHVRWFEQEIWCWESPMIFGREPQSCWMGPSLDVGRCNPMTCWSPYGTTRHPVTL